LSDHEFKGHTTPGPQYYFDETDPCAVAVQTTSVMKKHSSNVSLKMPSKGLSKSWRFEKSSKPDMGSYEV
jgi:hypothetical protein